MAAIFENIAPADTTKILPRYFPNSKDPNIPEKLFLREILEKRLTSEILSIPDLQRCVTSCIYLDCDSTLFVEELVRKLSLEQELFDAWFPYSVVASATSEDRSSRQKLESVRILSTNIAEPLRSELLLKLGPKLTSEKLTKLGCKQIQPPREELPVRSGDVAPEFVGETSSQNLEHQTATQLLKICTFLHKNQDVQAKRLAEKVLNGIKNDFKISELGVFLPKENPISNEMDFDREKFSDIEFDDEDIPLVGTPNLTNQVHNTILSQGRRPTIAEETRNLHVHPEKRATTIPSITIISALFGLRETTAVKIHAWMQKMAPAISLLYITCVILTVLLFTDTISSKYAYIVLTIFPVILLRLSLMNLYLTKQLLRYFETWFLLVQIFIGCIAGIDMFGGDIRSIAILFAAITQVQIVFYDAALLHSRIKFYFLVLAVITWFVTISTLYGGLWRYNSRTLDYGGYIKSTTGDFFGQRMLTMMFYNIKYLIITYYRPRCFVILTSRLSTSNLKIEHFQES